MADRGSALERLRRSWRGSAYLHLLDEAIRAPQLRRYVTIAVVSPKGGVGKTTITALLGGIFALLRRDRVVAVDTNPDFGSLGRSLTPAHGVFVDDLLEALDSPELTVTELDLHLARGPHGVMVVPAPTDPERMKLLDQAAYTRVIRRLQEMVGMVMLWFERRSPHRRMVALLTRTTSRPASPGRRRSTPDATTGRRRSRPEPFAGTAPGGGRTGPAPGRSR